MADALRGAADGWEKTRDVGALTRALAAVLARVVVVVALVLMGAACPSDPAVYEGTYEVTEERLDGVGCVARVGIDADQAPRVLRLSLAAEATGTAVLTPEPENVTVTKQLTWAVLDDGVRVAVAGPVVLVDEWSLDPAVFTETDAGMVAETVWRASSPTAPPRTCHVRLTLARLE